MSHQTAAESFALSDHTILFTPRIKHAIETQKPYKETPTFVRRLDVMKGTSTRKKQMKFAIGTKGYVGSISSSNCAGLG